MRKLKALIAGLTALCMCAVYMPLTENILPEISMLSAHAESSGTCGENLTWNFDETSGILIISGTGAIDSWGSAINIEKAPWYDFRDKIISVKLMNGVTEIGDSAFQWCSNLVTVSIPDTVTIIGRNAFDGCTSLSAVHLPANVESIGELAFAYCHSLSEVSLSNVTISLGEQAFLQCEKLDSIYLGNSLESIGDDCFKDCTQLASIVLPETLKTIGSGAFMNCSSLTELRIPASVTEIESEGTFTFSYCDNLENIYVDEANTAYASIDGALYNKKITTLYFCPNTWKGTFVVPDTVTSVMYAFWNCNKLTSVSIPASVEYMDGYDFSGCTSLESIHVDPASRRFESIDGVLYTKDVKVVNHFNDGRYLDKYPQARKGSFTVPDFVVNIGSYAFEECQLTELILPQGLKTVNWYVFEDCENLEELVFPDSLESFGSYAVQKCKNLKKITLPRKMKDIGFQTFALCEQLESINLPETLESVPYGCFWKCSSLKEISVPKSVNSIEGSAFNDCTSLETIKILNRDCIISDYASTIASHAIIYGYPDSTAQAYAEKYNRKFVALEKEPERDNKFLEGGDNWSFSNSRTNFGDTYFMQDSYYKKLLNGLNNIEKEKIYDAVRNTKWSGSCYGMATTSVLASSSILNPADYQGNANFLHDISAPLSDEVKSLINYYFMLQFTDNIQNQTRQAAYESEEAKLKKLIACLEDDSPALLTYFGYFNDSKFNYGGHGVVAYGVEYGTYSKDGKAYNGKILTYDNNAVDYDESYCLYFNTSDWSWVIPHYQLDSTKSSTLGFISDDVNLLNAHGYLNGETYQNPDLNYIAMLDADTMNEDYAIHKVNYANGTWINAPTAEDDIKLFSSLSDTQETNHLCFALKDAGSGYVMEMNSPTSMNLSMNYENTLLNATASKGLNMCFSPEGCIFLEGENTNYNMQIVLNESELVTDWYSFSISGNNADAVKLQKNKNGYILTSPDMKNIIAEAYNDADDAFINFSTDADSVLLYEIDKNTIGVKIDSDNNGTYDKLIAQTPESITGDANLDGNVDILDVITINKAILGKETLTRHQNEFSDVNQNGVPDSSDSLAVLKYIVGLTSSLKEEI